MTNAIHVLGGHKQERPRAGLLRGSALPVPNEDGPTIRSTTTLTASEDDGTYKTPSKSAAHITTSATLIPNRLEDTSSRLDYGGGLDDAPTSTQGCFGWRAPAVIPVCWLKRSPSGGCL
jgi:hypothetical protein